MFLFLKENTHGDYALFLNNPHIADNSMNHKRIERVREMEGILNRMVELQEQLTKAVDEWYEALPQYRKIIKYYSGPQWRRDYIDSDKGLFPTELPQGVLTEDLIYNMMITQRELAIHTAKVALEAIDNF